MFVLVCNVASRKFDIIRSARPSATSACVDAKKKNFIWIGMILNDWWANCVFWRRNRIWQYLYVSLAIFFSIGFIMNLRLNGFRYVCEFNDVLITGIVNRRYIKSLSWQHQVKNQWWLTMSMENPSNFVRCEQIKNLNRWKMTWCQLINTTLPWRDFWIFLRLTCAETVFHRWNFHEKIFRHAPCT